MARGGGSGQNEASGHPASSPREKVRKTALANKKACSHCSQVKSAKDFPPNRRTLDRLSSWCQACHVEATREWRSRRKAAERVASRKRLEEHLAKLREQSAARADRTLTVTAAALPQAFRRHSLRCQTFTQSTSVTSGSGVAASQSFVESQPHACMVSARYICWSPESKRG